MLDEPGRTYRVLNPGEVRLLYPPHDPRDATPAELTRMIYLGLLTNWHGDLEVTEKGRAWREMP